LVVLGAGEIHKDLLLLLKENGWGGPFETIGPEADMTGDETAGRVFDIKRYALHDGPGIRTSIHLKGCPLSCWWCHNPESQDPRPRVLFRGERCIGCGMCVKACPNGAISRTIETDLGLCRGNGACADTCPSEAREICGREMSVGDVMREVMKERIFYDQSGGGVTLSGGEPLSQLEFALRVLAACKKNDIRTAVDTCGFVGAQGLLETVLHTDLYLYDIKHMDPEKHKLYTGADNEAILSNLVTLGNSGAAVNARMPFIPGINTDEANLRATGAFLAKVKGITRLSLLPFHSAARDKHDRWRMKYKLRDAAPPTENSLRTAAGIIESYGVRVVIGG
jgi:pyruvate formate lyase activating enzyme